MFSISLGELATKLGGKLEGDKDKAIFFIQDSRHCESNAVCYVKSDKHLASLSSKSGAVIASSDLAEKIKQNFNCIIVKDPYLSFAVATSVFNEGYIQENLNTESIIHASVKIGQNSVINSNCKIGENVTIHDNVSVYPNTTIGANCIIHSGVVIGSDGFGFAPSKDGWQKIYHLGGVVIGDNVEIGANSAIDKGVLGDTVLEDGVKLDNHVHVAHNVRLGKNTAVAAQTAFAGSVNVGSNCQIAGHVGVTGHLSIADNVTVLANTLVTKSITKPGVYSGIMPMMEHGESLKFVAKLKKK